jgi:hypothetical protein
MAWTTFKLGRPGSEYEFTVPGNPQALSIDNRNIRVLQSNIEGDLKKSTVKLYVPSIRMNSNYLPFDERNKLASLMNITDAFLSFMLRDDFLISAEKALPVDVNTVNIANSSILRLEQALLAASASGHITITGVFLNAAGTGTNYYTSGSFDGTTGAITLGTPVADATVPVYVFYTYKGWLVEIEEISDSIAGGRSNLFSYDMALRGA